MVGVAFADRKSLSGGCLPLARSSAVLRWPQVVVPGALAKEDGVALTFLFVAVF